VGASDEADAVDWSCCRFVPVDVIVDVKSSRMRCCHGQDSRGRSSTRCRGCSRICQRRKKLRNFLLPIL
jgi:hypothetical protein